MRTYHVQVRDGRHLLEVTVGDITMGIGETDESLSDVRGQLSSPNHRACDFREEDTAEAEPRGVRASQDSGSVGDDLTEFGGTL